MLLSHINATKTSGFIMLKQGRSISRGSLSMHCLAFPISFPSISILKYPTSSSSLLPMRTYSNSRMNTSPTVGQGVLNEDPNDNLSLMAANAYGQLSRSNRESTTLYYGVNRNGKSFEEDERLRKKLVALVANPTLFIHLSQKEQNFLLGNAAYLGEVAALKILLAPPFIGNPRMTSFIAVRNGNKKVNNPTCFELLLNDPRTDIESSIEFILAKVIKDNELDFLKIIINSPRYLAISESLCKAQYPLTSAARHGRLECLKLLLNVPELDPFRFDNHALRVAASNGFPDCLSLLLKDPRCDPAVHGNIAIRTSSQNGHTECVKLLMADSRVDPSDMENGAQRSAYKAGHKDIHALLMKEPRVKNKLDAFLLARKGKKLTPKIPSS